MACEFPWRCGNLANCYTFVTYLLTYQRPFDHQNCRSLYLSASSRLTCSRQCCLQLCVSCTIVRRCCDCEFGADYKCSQATPFDSTVVCIVRSCKGNVKRKGNLGLPFCACVIFCVSVEKVTRLFLLRDAMLVRYRPLCYCPVSISLSITGRRSIKRLKAGSHRQRLAITQGVEFSGAKDFIKIPPRSPLAVVSNTGRVGRRTVPLEISPRIFYLPFWDILPLHEAISPCYAAKKIHFSF